MIFVSSESNKLTQNTIEALLKEKYIKVSDELFKYLADNNISELNKILKNQGYKTVDDKEHYFNSSTIIYTYNTDLSKINILRHEDDKYLLYMRYLDDDILVIDISQEDSFAKKEMLNYMITADIIILIILLLIILKMIYPLKKISSSIKLFGDGNYKKRIDIKSDDEIGKLSKTFNSMADNIQNLISSRQILLRDIAHELKTPIAKSKLAIEMLHDDKYKDILQRAMNQMDSMVKELLYLEKLNAQNQNRETQTFDAQTLLAQSLSKLFIDNEDAIGVSIKSNFKIKADLEYLSIAVKNLIDNALKHSIQKPVYIVISDKKIEIKNKAKKLKNDIDYYLQPFTQEDDSRSQNGNGLGLSLVKKVLDIYRYNLIYRYENGYVVFTIEF
jgi:two-component system OmpR family sensor kinase